MSFLNPLFLAALAAVAIPIVVHMLSRRRIPLFYFSSLRFLKASDRRSMKRVSLRRILLMLLRMAGIALLALAFARPVVRGDIASLFPGGGSRAGCILLDRSYSMGVESGEGTLFDAAKDRAREILQRFTPEDDVTLILFDSGQERVYQGGGDERAIDLFLDDAALSFETTDLRRAVRAGYDALRESRRESRELYIVSDFQQSSLAEKNDRITQTGDSGRTAKAHAPLPVRIYLVRVGEDPPRNAAIERIAAPGVTLHRGEIATIRLTLASGGGDARFPVELLIDGRRILERELEIGPSRLARTEFSFPVERSGWLRGEVRKRPDRLRADDRRFFALRVLERVPVLLVADERTLYLEQALSPDGGDSDIKLELKGYTEVTSEDLERAGVVVLGPGRDLRSSGVTLMERFVMGGGKVVMLLLPELEETARALSGHRLAINWMERNEGFVTIERPVASPYFLKALGAEALDAITRLRFRHAPFVSGVPEKDVHLLFSNGYPFIWEEERGAGSMLFCAIDPVPEAGDLVLSPYFLPIVQQVVLVTGRTGAEEGRLIGETIRWRGRIKGKPRYEMPPGEAVADRVIGLPIALNAGGEKRDGRTEELLLPGAESPGFLIMTDDTDTIAVFAVNPDCRLESDLDPASCDEAADSLDLEHYISVEAGTSLSRAVSRGREGREITLQLAVAAILLFVVESVVAQKRYKGGEGVG